VHHRHLLPNEIDLLLDEDSGFGAQPLREHVRACPDCRARLAEAQEVVSALDEVPLFSPRVGLPDRIMARVPVFVPWHVAARDTVTQWMPTGPTARALAAALVAVVGSLVTGLTLWIATRGDMLAVFTGLLGEQARSTVTNAAGDVIVALFGPQVVAAVQQVGPIGIALAAGGFLVASVATVLGLKLIATSSRARS
jgi:predicted anti-sigma-YlaC factor YlaD